MSDALTYVPGVGTARSCAVSVHHAPRPLRYVWHHILPQVCGGKTEADNLASLCDSCHFSVHRLLWLLTRPEPMTRANPAQLRLAFDGYHAALDAGTVDKIPDEGGGRWPAWMRE